MTVVETSASGVRWRDRWQRFGRPPRVLGIDVARGLALFGMIGAHVGLTPDLVWSDPTTWGNLVHGRASILFALVAGISVALATGAGDRPEGDALRRARLRMAGRAIAILAIGLILEFLPSAIAVILPVYGVLFLLIIPFIGLRRRTLVTVAVLIAAIGPTSVALLRAVTLGTPGPGLELLVVGVYPLTTWLPLMLVGIAIGRSNLLSPRFAAVLLGAGMILAVLGYGLGAVVSAAFGQQVEGAPSTTASSTHAPEQSAAAAAEGIQASKPVAGEQVDLSGMTCEEHEKGWVLCHPQGTSVSVADTLAAVPADQFAASLGALPTGAWSAAPHSGGTFEVFGSGGIALAVIGASLLLARPLRWLLIPVAAVGGMPLTAYAAHVVSVAYVDLGTGGDLVGGNFFWLVSVVTLLVLCTGWALIFGRGPLERITAWAAATTDRPRERHGDDRHDVD